MGKINLRGRGICGMRAEVKERVSAGQYTGFVSVACGQAGLLTPESAILSGASENGSVLFIADKSVMENTDGCAFTGLIITPFGTNEMSAEFRESKCEGGRILLRKWR